MKGKIAQTKADVDVLNLTSVFLKVCRVNRLEAGANDYEGNILARVLAPITM